MRRLCSPKQSLCLFVFGCFLVARAQSTTSSTSSTASCSLPSRRQLTPLRRRSTSSSSSSSLLSSSATTNPSNSTTSTTTLLAIRMVETQIWEGNVWKPSSSSGVPDRVPAPPNAEWVGPWKDDDWEYLRVRPHQAVRQRTWTRTYREVISLDDDDDKKKQKRVATTKNKKTKKESAWRQALQDEWNFKGFGVSLYKSLWTLRSCGVALRLPVTFNLDTFERNPALPSISTSVAIYYPWTLVVFGNISLRLEFVKWASRRVVEMTAGILLACLWVGLLRSLAMVVAALLYPITRNWPEFSATPAWIGELVYGSPDRPVVYSRTVEERLGCSVSWRISAERGYEHRTSYWHSVSPTLASIWQGVLRQKEPPDWIRRRSAALGLSTSAPIPDPPHVTTSTVLSLSGFHPPSLAQWRAERLAAKAEQQQRVKEEGEETIKKLEEKGKEKTKEKSEKDSTKEEVSAETEVLA